MARIEPFKSPEKPERPSRAEAEDEIAATRKMGGRIVGSGEPGYPTLLHYISGAPPLLTIAGGERLDWAKTVGIVGARNAEQAVQNAEAGDIDVDEEDLEAIDEIGRTVTDRLDNNPVMWNWGG